VRWPYWRGLAEVSHHLKYLACGNRFQLFTSPADLAQFFGGAGCFGGMTGVFHDLKYLASVVYYSWKYTGHLATYFKCFLSSWSRSILRVPLRTPHNHTDQLWHWRPPDPCTGSYATWSDAIRNWLPFQITWNLPGPCLKVHNIAILLRNDKGQTTSREQLKILQESFQTGWNHALNNNF